TRAVAEGELRPVLPPGGHRPLVVAGRDEARVVGLDVGVADDVGDPQPQELLALVAEQLAGISVRGHVAPGFVRDEDGYRRAFHGLAEEPDLDERVGHAQGPRTVRPSSTIAQWHRSSTCSRSWPRSPVRRAASGRSRTSSSSTCATARWM